MFLLRSGGQVAGEWINRDEPRRSGYLVRTTEGVELRLASDAVVQRVIETSRAETEYDRLAPTYSDTAAEQWRLAQWCRENGLATQRRIHLERVIALDVNHVLARRALGYIQVAGKWQTKEGVQRSEGYELYHGRWRLSQDIELQEEKAKQAAAENEWMQRLKRLRADLNGERMMVAQKQYEEIRDPHAIAPLAKLMEKEPNRRVKILYLDVLARVDHPGALQAMIATSLSDMDEEIFYECVDRLKKVPPHAVTKPYVKALSDKENVRVNRAAYAISKLGDEKLVSPLIDALVTTHRIVQDSGGSGQTTSSFDGNGNSAISRGGPTAIDLPVQNRRVLEALVELTGQNFDFNASAWRNWYNLEKPRIFGDTQALDLRRNASLDE